MVAGILEPDRMRDLLRKHLGVEVEEFGGYESVNFTAEEMRETLPDEKYSALTGSDKLIITVEYTNGGGAFFAHFVRDPDPGREEVQGIIVQNGDGEVTKVAMCAG